MINKMEIWSWLKSQEYNTDYNQDSFKMYYELDMPTILEEYHQWKQSQIEKEKFHTEMDKHLRTKSGIGGL